MQTSFVAAEPKSCVGSANPVKLLKSVVFPCAYFPTKRSLGNELSIFIKLMFSTTFLFKIAAYFY